MRPSPIESVVFAFEGLLPELDSPPIAARRALDHAGVRLTIEGWRSLPIDVRRALALAGAPDRVDAASVVGLAARANPPPQQVEPASDPDPAAPPEALVRALEPARTVDARRWSRLRALDRYALAHTYKRAVARSSYLILGEAYDAVLAASAPPMPPPSPVLSPVAYSTPGHYAAGERPVEVAPALSSHLGPNGEVHMVNVGQKPQTERRAVASAWIRMRPETLDRLARQDTPKGEVLAVARIAGITAAKKTQDLIPLCHVVALTRVSVDIDLDEATSRALVFATVEALDRTGVEMEAMVAASVACLTIYDMLKGIDREMVIGEVKLLEKSGGRSGHFRRSEGEGRA